MGEHDAHRVRGPLGRPPRSERQNVYLPVQTTKDEQRRPNASRHSTERNGMVETGWINLQLTNIGQWLVPHPPRRQWAAQLVAWRSAA